MSCTIILSPAAFVKTADFLYAEVGHNGVYKLSCKGGGSAVRTLHSYNHCKTALREITKVTAEPAVPAVLAAFSQHVSLP